MAKNVLVTGGAGFIGSNLVRVLVDRGDDVTVLDNLHTGAIENLDGVRSQIRVIEGSCDDLSQYGLDGFDLIFHMGIPSSSPMYKENPLLVGEAVNGFINVMELAVASGARVVYASTSSMYARCDPPHREDMVVEPFDYYTEARLMMERLAQVYYELHDVRSAGMRFFSVYGPNERAKGQYANIVSQFLWKLQEGDRPVIYGDGEQTRDFTHVSDIVDACLKASEVDLGAEVVNVGTGRATSFNEVIDLLNQKLGTNIEPEYVENPIDNYVRHTQADIARARKLLGYEPSIRLEEGVDRLVADQTGRLATM